MLLKSNGGGTCNVPCPPIFSFPLKKEMKIILQISCTNKFSHLFDEMKSEIISLIVFQVPD